MPLFSFIPISIKWRAHRAQAQSEGWGYTESNSDNYVNGGNQGPGAKDRAGVREEENRGVGT